MLTHKKKKLLKKFPDQQQQPLSRARPRPVANEILFNPPSPAANQRQD